MANSFMKRLYDMAQTPDNNGLSKFDEQKLRRELENNNKLFSRNAEVFRQGEPRFSTCKMYDPCPICDKCRNKASHLYVKCQNCQIPICVHTYQNRATMIKRENFKLNVTNKVKEELASIAKNFTEAKENNE